MYTSTVHITPIDYMNEQVAYLLLCHPFPVNEQSTVGIAIVFQIQKRLMVIYTLNNAGQQHHWVLHQPCIAPATPETEVASCCSERSETLVSESHLFGQRLPHNFEHI